MISTYRLDTSDRKAAVWRRTSCETRRKTYRNTRQTGRRRSYETRTRPTWLRRRRICDGGRRVTVGGRRAAVTERCGYCVRVCRRRGVVVARRAVAAERANNNKNNTPPRTRIERRWRPNGRANANAAAGFPRRRSRIDKKSAGLCAIHTRIYFYLHPYPTPRLYTRIYIILLCVLIYIYDEYVCICPRKVGGCSIRFCTLRRPDEIDYNTYTHDGYT